MTRPNPFSAIVTWRINWNQAKLRQKCVQSKYVEVGGKDCRLLVYPSGKLKLAPLQPSMRLSSREPARTPMSSNCRFISLQATRLPSSTGPDKGLWP